MVLQKFCLNDAVTKYLFSCFWYRGKDEQRPPDCPATAYPVLKLSEDVDLHGKDHIMNVDNWFHSPYRASKLMKFFPLFLCMCSKCAHFV